MAFAKKVNPNKANQELMMDYKQQGHINMDNTLKRLLASVPKELRPAWKRIMLAAQRKQTEFKQHAVFKAVRTQDGRRIEVSVDSRYAK